MDTYGFWSHVQRQSFFIIKNRREGKKVFQNSQVLPEISTGGWRLYLLLRNAQMK